MSLRIIGISSLVLLVTCALTAQVQHNLVLLDHVNRSPVQGALIQVNSEAGRCQALSDSLGRMEFGPVVLPATFDIAHPNYREQGTWEELPDTLYLRSFVRFIPPASIQGEEDFEYAETPTSGMQRLIPAQLEGNSRLSAVPLMGFVPGVRIDERGYGGSRRLSIRGGFSRSPFGVRGIPFYIDGIPFTGPEGSTNIEFLEADLAENLSVFKGPAPAVFGATANGAISLQTRQAAPGSWTARAGFTGASFSTLRTSLGLGAAYARHEIAFDHIFQESAGYREQEFNRKQQWRLKIAQHTGKNSRLVLHLNSWFGNWGLPGSLTREEAENDPEQARPFSVTQNAGLRKLSTVGALSYERRGQRTFLRASVFLSGNDKKNPYGTSPFFSGLKLEKSRGVGARLHAQSKIREGKHLLEWGAETQEESGYFHEYTNNGGEAGAQKYRNYSRFYRTFAFTGLALRFGSFRVNPALVYDIAGLSNSGYSEVLQRDLEASERASGALLPSLSVFYEQGKNGFSEWSLSWKRGLSRPGIFEIVDVENGIINTGLRAEQGDLLELSWALDVPERINAMTTAYGFIRKENILPAIDELERVSYVNGGDARLFGLEFSGSLELWRGRWLKQALLMVQGAVQRYYDSGSTDSLFIPGVPLHTAGMQALLRFDKGFSLDVQHRWSDRLPLNDANTEWLEAWNTVEVRLSCLRTYNWGSAEVFAGVQNLTDHQYTGFAQINAAGNRFYNPVPERNYYAGILIRPSGKIREGR